MAKKNSGGGSGIPLGGVLGLIFVTLKLAEAGTVADWSWWWVLSPFWITALLAFFATWIQVLWE